MAGMKLRSSEWLAIVYFVYVAAISPFYIAAAWRAWIVAAVVMAGFRLASRWRSIVRDLAPLAATLAAYREMNWFTPAVHDHHLERVWIVWDHLLLDGYGVRAAIEKTGVVVPGLLEMCYLLVYAVAPVALWALFASGRRDRVNQLWLAYLAGTLGAYALFPYFPSEPPRTAFPAADLPHVTTVLRQANLFIVGGYGIHSSVFPSAHVSSAFSAAWGLLAAIPERRWIGWSMAAYAVLVSIATVYGRYHYAVDVAAGLGVSVAAIAVVRLGRAEARLAD